jgi:phytochrome-interacting factor 3
MTEPMMHGCRSDGNEFAELLWENGHAVVHGRRKQPQAAFPPFTCGGAGSSSSSKAQERCPGSDPQLALLKTCSAGSMAPSRHDFCSGLDATRGNGDLDDTVPWIHYPIIEEDDDGAAAADSYSPDFFSELQAAAANLNPLPPPVHVHHTANNLVRSTGAAATMAREPEPPKESRRVSVPEPQAEFAAAKQPRLGDALMNFSLFSRPVAVARASLQQISAQRPPPPLVGADKPPSVTVPASTRLWESTVVQTSSGPRTAPAAVCIVKEDVRFACAAAPTSTAGIVAHQALPQDRIADNVALAPQRRLEGRKAPEAAVTALSVCSANGAGIGDDDSCRQHKRKISQAECSASQDDVGI